MKKDSVFDYDECDFSFLDDPEDLRLLEGETFDFEDAIPDDVPDYSPLRLINEEALEEELIPLLEELEKLEQSTRSKREEQMILVLFKAVSIVGHASVLLYFLTKHNLGASLKLASENMDTLTHYALEMQELSYWF